MKASSIAWKCLSALGNRSFTQLADCNIVDFVQADRRGGSDIKSSLIIEDGSEPVNSYARPGKGHCASRRQHLFVQFEQELSSDSV